MVAALTREQTRLRLAGFPAKLLTDLINLQSCYFKLDYLTGSYIILHTDIQFNLPKNWVSHSNMYNYYNTLWPNKVTHLIIYQNN